MPRRLLLALLFLLPACARGPGSDPLPVAVEPGTPAVKIDAWLSSLVPEGFSGVAAVKTPDGLILSKGYGLADDSTGTPITPGTVFGTGSITKQFTAAAILRLEMDGRLSVDDPIGEYFEGIPADKIGITLHHLLTHSAGFPGAIGDDYEVIDRTGFVRRALETELRFEPGTGYGYSNVGYSLLAAIIEQVTGESYEAYLHRVLFEPAGMEHTGYVIPDWSDRVLAVGYRGSRRWGRLDQRAWADDGPYWNLRGNGGILSTAGDMLRWDEALKGDRILSAAAKAKLYGRHVREFEDGDSWYGYGWVTWPTPRGTKLVKHNGGNGIFFADFLRYLDESVTIFVATNRSTRSAGDLGWTIADLVFNPSIEPPPPSWGSRPIAGFPDDEVGRTARATVDLLTASPPGDVGAFIDAHFGPGFFEMAPRSEHVRIMTGLQEELSGYAIGEIKKGGDRFEIVLEREGSETLILSVGVSPMDPTRITGLGVDAL